MKILGLRLNQLFFLIAAFGVLISLPWFSTWGMWLWLTANLLLLLGIIFVLFDK